MRNRFYEMSMTYVINVRVTSELHWVVITLFLQKVISILFHNILQGNLKELLNLCAITVKVKINKIDCATRILQRQSTNFMITPRIQINNTVVYFQSYTHQTYEENQSRNPVNSKPKIQQTMFRISRFRTMDTHYRTEGLGQ